MPDREHVYICQMRRIGEVMDTVVHTTLEGAMHEAEVHCNMEGEMDWKEYSEGEWRAYDEELNTMTVSKMKLYGGSQGRVSILAPERDRNSMPGPHPKPFQEGVEQ